ncbi:MAG TPA: hypothetical protein VF609_02945 [Flavisolibacter sp.]
MKKFLPIVSLLLLLFSCKKEEPLKDFRKTLAGTWELERTITWVTVPPVAPGILLVFKEDGTFERKRHDTLVYSGTYTLQQKQDCHPRSSNIILTTSDSSPGYEDYISVENNKLELSTPNCWADGGGAIYRRVK